MKVSLMITCLGDVFFPDVGIATVRLLRRLGVEVDFPQAQTCCGQPHFNSGYHDDARMIARHTIQAFVGDRLIVTPSGSCAAMVKLEYPKLFEDDLIWDGRAEDLARRTHELSDFLVNVLKVEDVGARFSGKVTYHMACHLRGLGIQDEPLRLLQNVKDLQYVALERSDECCGFGGSFSVRYPQISGAMVRDKVDFIEKTGADVVVATDAGCLMNIAGCLHRRQSKVKAMHLAEILVLSS
ncbi:MAG TPA: (Fe-S)-binding protein [Gemmataceae bacterium]|jgi:L-lactate dehydrogenase complex protein LldE|nr:(Fe-S)-binding protein [Gemmataceae bacterium]